MNTNIRLNLAIDRNRNRKIEKEEVLDGLDEIRPLDKNGDNYVHGAEFKDVYFEYGEDVWLDATRSHNVRGEKMTTTVGLQYLSLEPPAFKLNTKYKRNSRW